MRIVSLLPSATETVFALGAGGSLVGRSAECDYPPIVRSLPVVMAPRTLDAEASSVEIDRRVSDMLGRAESLYSIDLDMLRSLAPDVVLTQDLCRVCSVTPEEVQAACSVTGLAPRVVTLSPTSLDQVWSTVREIGDAVGVAERGRALEQELRGRSTSPPTATKRAPRVAIVEWLDPPILAGLWAPDMIRAAGGTAVSFSDEGAAHRTSWTEVAHVRPDLVLLSPCSFSVTRTKRELATLPADALAPLGEPALGIWLADEAYFSRPGPRLASGVELLRRLLRNEGWAAPPMPIERLMLPGKAFAR